MQTGQWIGLPFFNIMARTQENKVKSSPLFSELMKFYDENYKKMPVKDIADGMIKIDPSLPRTPTRHFIHYLNKKRKQKVENIIEAHTEDNALKDAVDTTMLFRKIRDRAHEMGDTVMEDTAQELMNYKAKGKPIPDFKKKMVMGWMFKFKESEQKDKQIELMSKVGDREERLVDGLLNSLIYSRNLQPEDIIEGEYEDLEHNDSIQIAEGNPERTG